MLSNYQYDSKNCDKGTKTSVEYCLALFKKMEITPRIYIIGETTRIEFEINRSSQDEVIAYLYSRLQYITIYKENEKIIFLLNNDKCQREISRLLDLLIGAKIKKSPVRPEVRGGNLICYEPPGESFILDFLEIGVAAGWKDSRGYRILTLFDFEKFIDQISSKFSNESKSTGNFSVKDLNEAKYQCCFEKMNARRKVLQTEKGNNEIRFLDNILWQKYSSPEETFSESIHREMYERPAKPSKKTIALLNQIKDFDNPRPTEIFQETLKSIDEAKFESNSSLANAFKQSIINLQRHMDAGLTGGRLQVAQATQKFVNEIINFKKTSRNQSDFNKISQDFYEGTKQVESNLTIGAIIGTIIGAAAAILAVTCTISPFYLATCSPIAVSVSTLFGCGIGLFFGRKKIVEPFVDEGISRSVVNSARSLLGN